MDEPKIASRTENYLRIIGSLQLIAPGLIKYFSPERIIELLELDEGKVFEDFLKESLKELDKTTISKVFNAKEYHLRKDIEEPHRIKIEELQLIRLFSFSALRSYRKIKNEKQRNKKKSQIEEDSIKEWKSLLESSFEARREFEKVFSLNLDLEKILFEKAKRNKSFFGLRHAECLLKQQDRFPEQWKNLKPEIFFPGTLAETTGSFFRRNHHALVPTLKYRPEKEEWAVSYFDIHLYSFLSPESNFWLLKKKRA